MNKEIRSLRHPAVKAEKHKWKELGGGQGEVGGGSERIQKSDQEEPIYPENRSASHRQGVIMYS